MMDKLSAANGRFTVGFLDENSYYDYHNLIISGIHAAAQKYGINIVRFSLFTGHVITGNVPNENIFLEGIKRVKLDGLIYLGWSRLLDNRDVRSIFPDMPLFCLGCENKGIPSAYFNGEIHIKEILLHLICRHKFRKIAFIAPYWHDPREDLYIETMKEYGIYDPRLYVDETEMRRSDYYERGVRAVHILIDERHARPDAIVSLYSDEAYAIFNELNRRGISVPGDIALTSYEDGETCKFSTPAFTTVYFPWKELGYFSCESMYRQLLGAEVPILTQIPGRTIYRGSCGCIPDSVILSSAGDVKASHKCFEEVTDEEFEDIAGKIAQETDLGLSEIGSLLNKFKQAFHDRIDYPFLGEMEMLFRRVKHNSSNSGISNVAPVLRRLLLPYFLPYSQDAADKLIWAEDIFFRVQVILQNKLASAWFREEVMQKNIRLRIKEIGQILITNFTVTNLLNSLEINLPKLGIIGCYIYLFKKDGLSVDLNDSHLEFEFSNSKRIESSEAQGVGMHEGFSGLISDDRPYFLTSHLLHNGDDFIGLVIFEPTHMEMGIYQSVATQISTALNGIILFEKLDTGYRRLMDQAHKKGMADISTGILHNIGNILNNINVSTHSLMQLLEGNTINDLLMANNLLKNRFDDLDDFIRNDPKGKTLMQFYVSLSDSFKDFRSMLQVNIGKMSSKINLIDEIITAQQSYTGVKSNLKTVELIAIIEDVLKMHQTSIEKHGIQVIMNYGRTAKALANRTKLFHVLTNIVKNAMEAMEAVPVEARRLAITVTAEKDKVFIRVSDSGNGIEPGHLEDIFAYGFTTKINGHGFGLHSCANYMAEMNGRLWAESAGTGMGATFVMQLRIG